MNKFFIIICAFIYLNTLIHAQQKGFIKFSDQKIWLVQIDDSLYTSNTIIEVNPGTFSLKARPQISYSWPSIYVEDEIEVTTNDTVFYSLEKNVSVYESSLSQAAPTITLYSNKNILPNISDTSYLKDGLILGAIATNWLSFYLKRIADSHYGKYKKAGSSADIRKHKNNFRDFDLYSQIGLGVSSALLTGYIYFTLFD